MDMAMLMEHLRGISIHVLPVIEIAILAFLIYKTLYYLRGTRGANVLAGMIVALLVLNIISKALKFEVIAWLLSGFWGLLGMAVIVIFQPELRRAFAQLGSMTNWRRSRRRETVVELVTAVLEMSRKQVGAIIVMERRIGMQALIDDSVKLDVRLNALLIESIFFPNAPLHDGAMIVRNDRIVAVRAILPLSRQKLSRTMGTRHRAALGITEETDAVVIVVSEETGMISLACRGAIVRGLSADNLESHLHELLFGKAAELPEEPVTILVEAPAVDGNGTDGTGEKR